MGRYQLRDGEEDERNSDWINRSLVGSYEHGNEPSCSK
jgi:hypothetical protein